MGVIDTARRTGTELDVLDPATGDAIGRIPAGSAEAADSLIFAVDLDEAREALADVEALTEHLVATGRWTAERAEQLGDDLLACGPVAPVA